VAYACPRCDRLVPDDDVDVAARTIRCESCGATFEEADLDAFRRWAPAPPPPPVPLLGVPANVDVLQPGDGTIEFRIHHLQRRVHGPEALMWLVWATWCAALAAYAIHQDRLPLALLAVLLVWPAARGLAEIRRRALQWTHLRWDRVDGSLRVWTTGPGTNGEERRTRFGGSWDVDVRVIDDKSALVGTDGARETALAEGVPYNPTTWVVTAMRAMKA
jgi:hypothetical protein